MDHDTIPDTATPHRGIKWHPKLKYVENQYLAAIPKATLFVVARQLAALVAGNCDDLGFPAITVLCNEWKAQYLAGIVPQKPPKHLDTDNW